MAGEAGARRPGADSGAEGQDILGVEQREREAVLAWVGENMTLVRRSAFGQRTLYWSLGVTFAVGLAAHVGGFLLKSATAAQPLLLAADLLYGLGGVLWTGVVLVLFVEVFPRYQKRQWRRLHDAYLAAVGDRAGTGTGGAPDSTGAPT
ncbi:MAG: hypothetical protein J2P15_20595 [Micromonosporaceae bacterium]|nr:hypothetical protein [Micromonosporaceae bacterium]